MTGADSTLVALAPVREALLASAHADAERQLATAEGLANQLVARAQEDARLRVEEARRQGAADAADAARLAAAHTRREARGIVLGAQRAAYEQLLEACREGVRSLLSEPDWPRLQAAMGDVARASVGEGAVLTKTADGVVASSGSRRVELTLGSLAPTIADRLVDEGPLPWGAAP
jgi:vacuolar-type H+-ATPase subunit E/Vma4